jgi:phenylalanyl-tRNA synthetase beta chain
MKISLNWIKDFVDLDGISVRDIWYRFTMSAAEVEDVVEMGANISNVVVGRVQKIEPHPDSAKLKICQVDAGANGVIQSVCGAPNVREGILVPFALEGGSIRKVEKITRAKVSGVDSCGIICSASEIGISDNHEGVLILEGDYQPGTDIKKVIDIDDIIIEIDNKSLTNRPDLWGHYGIAREMAAIFRRKLKPLEIEDGLENKTLPDINIRIEDAIKCFRFCGLRIDGIKVKNARLNMQTRLYYCGMRPISLLVDLTNYLMLELGQPMHAYDKRLLQGIVVKSPAEPFKFKTLDSVERTIPADVLMICNDLNGSTIPGCTGEQMTESSTSPVGIAGIMGGENTEVREDTDGILLESANFEGASLRKNSTRLGLRTEASARFEKMLDPQMAPVAIKRFVKLLKEVQEDVQIVSNLTDTVAKTLEPVKLTINRPFIDKYVGNSISDTQVVEILKSLEFGVDQKGDTFHIDVPSFRSTKDITMNADIIEEISRIYGYDNIVPETIEVPLQPLQYNEDRLAEHQIRDLLAEKFGMSEVNSYIWYNNTFNSSIGIAQRGNVKLLNPHASNMDTLRDSMVPTMLEFAEVNRKAYDEFSLFEIGGVFNAADSKSVSEEHKTLCVLKASKQKSEDVLFYELKGALDALVKSLKNRETAYQAVGGSYDYPWVHPVKSVSTGCDGKSLGYLSVLHPQIKQNVDKKLNVVFFEINLKELFALERKRVKFAEPSRYPGVTLDFSFLADKAARFETVAADIDGFKGHPLSSILNGYQFVDIYTGKGLPEDKKSMTFRFRIGSREKTLSSDEINQFSDGLLKYMESKGYTLR